MLNILCTTCIALIPTVNETYVFGDSVLDPISLQRPTMALQNQAAPKRKNKTNSTKNGRNSRYEYTSIGPAASMRNTRNLKSSVVAGPVQFESSDGSEPIGGSSISFNTSELWNTEPLLGVKVNHGQMLKRNHFFKVSVSLMQNGQRINGSGGNSNIKPIDMHTPWLGQLDYTWGRAFKVFGTMAYAGANVFAAGYNTNMDGWSRPDNYSPREKIFDYDFTIAQLSLPPRLRKRQVGVGMDFGAMLVSYKHTPNTWIGLEWNGTVGVSMRDTYITNSLMVVYR